jgi:hypothetical protein
MPPDRSSTRHSTVQGTTGAARHASAGGGRAGALVAQVAQLARERDEFACHVAILDVEFIELTDRMLEDEAVRTAYRPALGALLLPLTRNATGAAGFVACLRHESAGLM